MPELHRGGPRLGRFQHHDQHPWWYVMLSFGWGGRVYDSGGFNPDSAVVLMEAGMLTQLPGQYGLGMCADGFLVWNFVVLYSLVLHSGWLRPDEPVGPRQAWWLHQAGPWLQEARPQGNRAVLVVIMVVYSRNEYTATVMHNDVTFDGCKC